ncbi:unnamed protein product [Heterobilharzia americana]|nr:unnamed protein product [Heterobilharzia americana]
MDVLSKIETVAFQVLKFLESDAQAGVQEAYPLRLLLKKPVEFTRLMVILKMIHEAIREKKIITKRSIYYSNPNLFKRQSTIDPILSKICHNFDLPRCALTYENGLAITETIFRTGLDISLSSIDCSAQFVLVVEKDTIFQKLLNESFYEKFKPCLLVTAKGYPDLMSRNFLLN